MTTALELAKRLKSASEISSRPKVRLSLTRIDRDEAGLRIYHDQLADMDENALKVFDIRRKELVEYYDRAGD